MLSQGSDKESSQLSRKQNSGRGSDSKQMMMLKAQTGSSKRDSDGKHNQFMNMSSDDAMFKGKGQESLYDRRGT